MVTPLSALTEQERAQAVERFHVLRPCLEEDIPLLQIASQQQVSLRTLRRWIERYHIEGLPGLIRKRRADRGERRRLPSYLQQFVEGLALHTPPLSVATEASTRSGRGVPASRLFTARSVNSRSSMT